MRGVSQVAGGLVRGLPHRQTRLSCSRLASGTRRPGGGAPQLRGVPHRRLLHPVSRRASAAELRPRASARGVRRLPVALRLHRPAGADDGRSHSRGRGWSPRSLPPWARVALFTVGGILLLGAAFDVGTASPRVCLACHEMELRAHSWSESAHTVVACVKCHQEPTEWYEVPQRVASRARLLSRDVSAHFSGDFADPVDAPAANGKPISDAVCLQCHDPNRKATSGFRILINHAEHAKRNGSCVSCHVRTAHPLATRGEPLSLMGKCYTCHGQPDYPEATAECEACHPSGYELLPPSHAVKTWARGHGDASEQDQRLCTMCHQQEVCNGCHGLPMPHPAEWAAGVNGTDGHAAVAKEQPETCDSCHDGGPDLCTMCHHTSFDPMKGLWIEQHATEVESEGKQYCERCHASAYCSFCHTTVAMTRAD
ncbi:MAG: hypothetical protein EG823_08440 [Actinobacteria bacterium]|nr:hypothetical protein [Actinomycetota bacterium]